MFNEIRGLLYRSQHTVCDIAVISNLAQKGLNIRVVLTQSLPWIEIDYPEDFETTLNEVLPRIQGQWLSSHKANSLRIGIKSTQLAGLGKHMST